MHELAITESVVQAVTERLPDATVRCVYLEIGPLSGVVPESVRFCFDLVTEGTSLAGAKLDISQPSPRCECVDCGREFEPDGPIPLCPCGSTAVSVLAGDELRITAVEVVS
jgi:hydrogenase nickel incorporation protein HypA/HybF